VQQFIALTNQKNAEFGRKITGLICNNKKQVIRCLDKLGNKGKQEKGKAKIDGIIIKTITKHGIH
jgi:hypothetical protein